MDLDAFRKHVNGINDLKPLEKLLSELDEIIKENNSVGPNENKTFEVRRGSSAQRSEIFPPEYKAAREIVEARIEEVAPTAR